MPSRRMPSQSRIKSQMRSAQRKAESQMKDEIRKAQRQAERDLSSAVNKWERDTNRKLRAARPKVTYSVSEQRYLAPVQEAAERQAQSHPERRDVFLCHAWDDREGVAQELHDLLESFGVEVWFSEKDIPLGTSLIRAIDKGLKMSRIGLVLVTPAMVRSLSAEGIADKELSALLATDRVIPVTHGTTFDDLRDESPLLASRSGLSTQDSSLEAVAVKIADTLRPDVD